MFDIFQTALFSCVKTIFGCLRSVSVFAHSVVTRLLIYKSWSMFIHICHSFVCLLQNGWFSWSATEPCQTIPELSPQNLVLEVMEPLYCYHSCMLWEHTLASLNMYVHSVVNMHVMNMHVNYQLPMNCGTVCFSCRCLFLRVKISSYLLL